MIADPVLLDDWHPVASAEELGRRKVLPARLLGEDIVVWQDGGEPRAWRDLCVHRGTRLSLGRVEAGTLRCPYHGWVYGGDGRCIHVPAQPDSPPPARARAQAYRATCRHGLIWASLGRPERDPPPFPEWDDAGFRKLLCGPYPVEASGPRIVENFLDVAHFAFVHDSILGTPERPEIEDYRAVITEDGVEATGVRVYQPDPYGTGQGDLVSYTWMWMAMNYGHDLPAEDLVAWQDRIFAQDRPILESQRPDLLPLDLAAEMNVRADRTAVTYRRWLRQRGLSFGIA